MWVAPTSRHKSNKAIIRNVGERGAAMRERRRGGLSCSYGSGSIPSSVLSVIEAGMDELARFGVTSIKQIVCKVQ